jgi:hypothetical protein
MAGARRSPRSPLRHLDHVRVLKGSTSRLASPPCPLPPRPIYPFSSSPSTPRERERETFVAATMVVGRRSIIRPSGCRGVAPLVPHVCDTSGGMNPGRAALNSSPELAPRLYSALRRGLLLPVVRKLGKSPHRVCLCILSALRQLIELRVLVGPEITTPSMALPLGAG